MTAPRFSPLHGGLVPPAPEETVATKEGGKAKEEGASGKKEKKDNQSEKALSPSPIASAAYSPTETIFQTKPKKSSLSLDERVRLCLLVGSNGGEVIQEDEVRKVLQEVEFPICYDGFEPSGRMHIAQGVMKAINVNRLTSAGCVFVFWVADFFGLLNNKMGGDIYKIKKVGEYFVEVWKAVGMDMDNVRFLWTSDEIKKNPEDYWLRVMNIARVNNIARIKRCGQIMGRGEGDDLPAAQIMYPCMQCADIFYLKADMCQLGMDQRKVNMLAREYCDAKIEKRARKPVIISHGMLPGLKEGQEKMSKSDPDSAIFMEDSEKDIQKKIKKAFCPEKQIVDNPCVAYVKMIVFPKCGKLAVKRKPENGGDIVFETEAEFEAAFSSGSLHPGDLKTALAAAINEMVEPVRAHFRDNERARELLEEIKSFSVTR